MDAQAALAAELGPLMEHLPPCANMRAVLTRLRQFRAAGGHPELIQVVDERTGAVKSRVCLRLPPDRNGVGACLLIAAAGERPVDGGQLGKATLRVY